MLFQQLLSASLEANATKMADVMNEISQAVMKSICGKQVSPEMAVYISKKIHNRKPYTEKSFCPKCMGFVIAGKCVPCGNVCGTECDKCYNIFDDKHIQSFEGVTYCDDCFDKNVKECYGCESLFYINDLEEKGGSLFCSGCSDEWTVCHECGNAIKCDDATNHNDESYCDDCFHDNFTYCFACENYFPNEDTLEVHGENYCNDCAPNEEEEDCLNETSSKIKLLHDTINIPENVKEYLSNFYDGSYYDDDFHSEFKIGKPDNFKLEFGIKKDVNPKDIFAEIYKLIKFDIGYYRITINGDEKIKKELYPVYNELYCMVNYAGVSKDMKYVEYSIDNKTVTLKIGKFFERYVKIIEKIQKVIGDKLTTKIDIKELKDNITKKLPEIYKAIESKVEIKCVLSNDLNHKIQCGDSNDNLGSCQVSSNNDDLAKGFYDMFVNPDIMPILLFKGDDVIGRFMIRRMKAPNCDKTFILLDRLYCTGSISNARKTIYTEVVKELENILPKDYVIVLPSHSKHDCSVSDYVNIPSFSLSECIKDKYLETGLRPFHRQSSYYHDSNTVTFKDDDNIYDVIRVNDCNITKKI